MRTVPVAAAGPMMLFLPVALGTCSSPTGEGDVSRTLFTLYEVQGTPVTAQLLDGPVLWVGSDGSEFRIEGGMVSCREGASGEYYGWSLTLPDGTYEYGGSNFPIECRMKNRSAMLIRHLATGEEWTAEIHRSGEGCPRLTKRLPSAAAFERTGILDATGIPPEVVLPATMPLASYEDYSCDEPAPSSQ